jgi:hypothetical protein
MMLGLLIGVAASAVAWGLLWNHMSGALIIVVIVAKLGIGIICLMQRNWRPFGQGLIVSIAVGCLIFFGRCAMSLNEL